MKKSFIDKLLETIQFIFGLLCIILMGSPLMAIICWLIAGCYEIQFFDTACSVIVFGTLPALIALMLGELAIEKILLFIKERR